MRFFLKTLLSPKRNQTTGDKKTTEFKKKKTRVNVIDNSIKIKIYIYMKWSSRQKPAFKKELTLNFPLIAPFVKVRLR